MNQLHTPPALLKMILYQKSRYHQVENTSQPQQLIGSREEIYNIINSQKNIDWNHFHRGRLTKLFQSVINSYLRRNKLPLKFSVRYWSRHMIKALLHFHNEAWKDIAPPFMK